jgi:autotransporter-associated beta strand protein
MAILLATVAASASAALAQTSWSTATSGNWGDAPSWSAGVPNATSAIANFSNDWTGQVVTVNGTFSVGTISANDTVTNGSLTLSGGTLTLDNGAGRPVISSSTFGESAANRFKITSTLAGSNGFTRSGSGYVDFSNASNTFSGTIYLEQGSGFNVINGDVNLGNVNNGINVSNTGTGGTGLYVDATGTPTLAATRTITIAGGGDFWTKIKSPGVLTIAGPITGTGNLRKNDSGQLVLTGQSNYSGVTKLELGVLRLQGGDNRLPTTTTLQFLNASSTAGAVVDTLSIATGTSQTVVGATFAYGAANQTQVATGGGALVIANATADFTVNATNGATADLSGLGTFSYTGGTGRAFKVLPTTTANSTAKEYNSILLAKTGGGVNTITVPSITVGSASGSSSGAAFEGRLGLGATNTLNTTTLAVGGFNGSGSITVQSGVSNPSLKIRGLDGTSRITDINLGATSSGVRSGEGTIDLSGGTVDILATNLTMNSHIASSGNAASSSLSFGGGSLDATNVVMGVKSGTGTPTLTTTINQAGGTARITTLSFGTNAAGGGAASYQSNYNLSGGTLSAVNLIIGTSDTSLYAGSSVRSLNFSGGTITTVDANTDMNVDGTNTSGGRIALNITGATAKSINVPTNRTITLGNGTTFTGSGAFSKDGNGTLLLNTANGGTYSGAITVNAGKIQIGGSTSNAFTNLNNSATINLAAANTSLDLFPNSGFVGFTPVISGSGAVNKFGGGSLTLSGLNLFTGAVSVNLGTLSVSTNQNLGDTAANTAVNLNNGALQLTTGFGTLPRTLNTSNGGTGSLDISEAGGANTVTWTGGLTGAGAFQKVGTGRLILPSINSTSVAFTGGFTVRSGTVDSASVLNLPGKVTLGSNTNNNAVVNLSGSGTWGSASAANIFVTGDQSNTAVVNVTGSYSLLNSAVANGTTTWLIGNSGGVSQTSTATFNVSAAGTVTYSGGIVEIGGSRQFSLGKTTGTLNLNGNALVDIQAGPGGVYLGNRAPGASGTSTGSITLNDTAILRTARTITNGLNGGVGSITFNGGTLQAGADNVDMVSNVASGLIADGGLVVDDNGKANVSMSQDLTNASGSAGGILKLAGPGNVTLNGNINIAGNIAVASGKLTVTKPLSLPGVSGVAGVDVTGGEFSVAVPAYASASTRVALNADYVSVAASGKLSLAPVDRTVSTTNHGVAVLKNIDLASTAPGVYGGLLDLGNNDMIVKGGATQLDELRKMVRAYITTGNSGIGSALTSLTSFPYTTFAVLSNDAGGGVKYFDSYDGQSLTASDVIVKYTYVGDVNLDGVLDGRDFKRIQEGVIFGQSGWSWGDVDASGGAADSSDLQTFVTAYNWYTSQSNPVNLGNGSSDSSSTSSIPEPSSVALGALAMPLLGRRRRA